jgi:hypothetical protein
MPKITVDAEEIIEKMRQFSGADSEENKKILQQILSELTKQGGEISELKKEILELKKKLETGNINISGGTGSSTSMTPSQQEQKPGEDSTSSISPEAQQKEKE